jgi:hypothetical protein
MPLMTLGDIDPVDIDPVDIDPVDIDPVDIDPVDIYPVDIDSVDIDSVANMVGDSTTKTTMTVVGTHHWYSNGMSRASMVVVGDDGRAVEIDSLHDGHADCSDHLHAMISIDLHTHGAGRKTLCSIVVAIHPPPPPFGPIQMDVDTIAHWNIWSSRPFVQVDKRPWYTTQTIELAQTL